MDNNKSKEKSPFLIYIFLLIVIALFYFFGINKTKLYTVTFDSNGGSTVALQNVDENETVSEPESPVSNKCDNFVGWYTDQELTTKFDFSTPIKENITLYAGWNNCSTIASSTTYFIFFDSNGGSTIKAQEVYIGRKAIEPEKPTHNNCSTFTGWYTEPSLRNLYDFNNAIKNNLTLYAGWDNCSNYVPVKYKVSFQTNGGVGVSTQSVSKASTAFKPQDPTKTNCTFKGWYKDSKLKNKYNFNSAVNNDLTLYAKWSCKTNKKTYNTVSFVTNTKSKISPQKILKGSKVNEPFVSKITNCTLDGWYKDSKFKNRYNFNDKVTKNITLYAKWTCTTPEVKKEEKKLHVVTFFGGDLDPQIVEDGNKAIRPGYIEISSCSVTEWYTDPYYVNKYDFDTPVKKDILLYGMKSHCKGEKNMDYIPIKMNNNGGSGRAYISAKIGERFSGNPPIPYHQYCQFGGWYDDKTLKLKHNFNEVVNNCNYCKHEIYAKWINCSGYMENKNDTPKFAITFLDNNDEFIKSVIVKYGETINKYVPNAPMKRNGLFRGWKNQIEVIINEDEPIVKGAILRPSYWMFGEGETIVEPINYDYLDAYSAK